jgi:1-deoxy-D-xylulose-5-phosphate reductoisomerase
VRLAALGSLGGCVGGAERGNEEAVGAFVAGTSSFTGITDVLVRVLDAAARGRPIRLPWRMLAAQEWARARELATDLESPDDDRARDPVVLPGHPVLDRLAEFGHF